MRTDDAAARRYARGLAECAAENNSLARTIADVRRAADLLDASSPAYSADLAAAMASPSASVEQKTAALDSVLSQLGIGGEARAALASLIRRGRVALVPRVAACLEEMAATAEFTAGTATPRVAVVRTARQLSPAQEERLAAALAEKFASPVRLRIAVDPALLAGARVTVGEWSLDGTVAGQLDALRRRLVAVSQTEALGAASTTTQQAEEHAS